MEDHEGGSKKPQTEQDVTTSGEERRNEKGNLMSIENDPHRAALEDNPANPERMTFMKFLAIFFLGLAISAPVGIGFLIMTPLLQTIGRALPGNANAASWIASGWSVACGVSFPLGGSFSDIFGRRYVIIGGQVFVLIGAIVAATAKTLNTVVAGSTILGFGAGFVFVIYPAIAEIVPNKGTGLAWSEFCINVPWGIFQTLIAVNLPSWRWVYYLCIILSAVCLVGIALVYYPPSRPRKDYDKTRLQEVWELDWIGMALYSAGLTVFLIGLSWAGLPGYPWRSVSVILPIILGAVIFILCFVYDFYFAKNAFFPYSLFRLVREFSLLLVAMFVAGMVFFSMASILPETTTFVFTSNGLQVGLIQLPNGFGQWIGGALIPAFMHKIKHIRWQLVTAMAIQTIFTAAYAAAIPQNKGAWMALQLFGNACFAWATLAAIVTASLNVPLRDLGIATGIIGTFRNTGGAVGIAIFNTIRNGVLGQQLAPRIIEAATSNGFPASEIKELIPAVELAVLGEPKGLMALKGMTPAIASAAITAFKDAQAFASQRVFLSTIPFGVIATITVIFVKESSKYLTNHTAVHLEKEHIRDQAQTQGDAA